MSTSTIEITLSRPVLTAVLSRPTLAIEMHPQGAAGIDGSTWYRGTGVPADATGLNGDFYIDPAAMLIWGPKSAGTWSGTGPLTMGPKANLSSNRAPTATDDSTAGYSVGSIWINTGSGIAYTCVADDAGAAVWSSGSGSGGGADYLDGGGAASVYGGMLALDGGGAA